MVCRSGQRAYYATRILLQHGFDAKVRSGGMLSHAILATLAAIAGRPGVGRVRVKAVTVQPGVAELGSLRGGPRTGREHGLDPGRGGGGGHLRHRRRDRLRRLRLGAPGRDRLVLGHESLGRVVDAGGNSGVQPGDLVVGIVRRPDPVPCRTARWASGTCVERSVHRAGHQGDRRLHVGALADRARLLHQDRPSLGILGVLLEPTTVVAKAWELVQAMRARAFWEPKVALVTGAGPIGLLAAQIGVRTGSTFTCWIG